MTISTASISMNSKLMKKAREYTKKTGRTFSGYISFLIKKDLNNLEVK